MGWWGTACAGHACTSHTGCRSQPSFCQSSQFHALITFTFTALGADLYCRARLRARRLPLLQTHTEHAAGGEWLIRSATLRSRLCWSRLCWALSSLWMAEGVLLSVWNAGCGPVSGAKHSCATVAPYPESYWVGCCRGTLALVGKGLKSTVLGSRTTLVAFGSAYSVSAARIR